MDRRREDTGAETDSWNDICADSDWIHCKEAGKLEGGEEEGADARALSEASEDDGVGTTELLCTSKLAVLLPKSSAWALPVAGAYHQSVVTPTGKVYVA